VGEENSKSYFCILSYRSDGNYKESISQPQVNYQPFHSQPQGKKQPKNMNSFNQVFLYYDATASLFNAPLY